MGQITGPNGGRTIAHTQINRDYQFRVFHIGRAPFLAIAGSHPALLGNQDIAQPNLDQDPAQQQLRIFQEP